MIITEILARNSRRYPKETALVERSPADGTRRSITWEDFYTESNRFANALEKLGMGKNDKVVQLMTNCLEWLPVYFGILGAGCWVAPLNFRFESSKILRCSEVAEAKVFVFGEEFIERIEEIRQDLDRFVQTFIFVGQADKCPEWALHYDTFIK
ncbi:MAG: class I adenylate-forming enzyme family protein, partial [Desulfobacteraceae bacterium]